ncbi:MAG: RNA-binding S4 domain-containing protein [Lautropia mirabilis]|nr:RNA-binding S4 domain-containing protein [Lautropia mirabilis]
MRADAGPAPVRVDKWLWAARFFKTRALAQDAVENGRVLVQGERVKVARLLKGGELLRIRTGDVQREVVVMALSSVRGPAPVAQTLYQETPESVAAREAAAERRRFECEPAQGLHGRPSKRDRRELSRIRLD